MLLEALYFHANCPCVRLGCCFSDIFGIRGWLFSKLLSLVHLSTVINRLGFGVKRSKVKFSLVSVSFKFTFFTLFLFTCIFLLQLNTKAVILSYPEETSLPRRYDL